MRDSSRSALTTIVIVVFVDFLGYGILIPIIPLYAEHFGASEFVVGLLIASYALMQFLFAPVLGRLSDRYGRRPILLASIAGNAVAYVLFGLAGSIAVLFVARLLSGTMAGNVAVAQAHIADTLPRERRAKGFGVLGAAFGLGLVFGPALGGFFSGDAVVAFGRQSVPMLSQYITRFSLPSFVTALIAAGNLLLAYMFLPASKSQGDTDRSGTLASLHRLLDDRLLSGLVLSYSLRSLAFSSMVSMFVVFTADVYGYGTVMNGYILAFIGIVVSLNQGLLVDKIIELYRELRVVAAGAAAESLFLALVPFAPIAGELLTVGSTLRWLPVAPELLSLLLIVGCLATGDAFTTISINTLISKSSTEETQGENLGFAQSGDGLARAIGPVIAGWLYTSYGYWIPFIAGGVTMVPVSVIAVHLSNVYETRSADTMTK